MNYLIVSILIVLLVLGLGLGIYSICELKPMFGGLWTSWQKRLTNVFIMGVSTTMIFMCIILVAGLIDPQYIWSLRNIINLTLFSLIPGFIVSIGASWQFFITSWYKKKVTKKLGDQNNKRKLD